MPGKVLQLGVGVFQRGYWRLGRHAAFRTAARMILSNFGVHRTGIDRAGGWLLDSRCVLMLMLMLMRGGRLRFVRQRLLARLVMYHANNLCKSERASSPCTRSEEHKSELQSLLRIS